MLRRVVGADSRALRRRGFNTTYHRIGSGLMKVLGTQFRLGESKGLSSPSSEFPSLFLNTGPVSRTRHLRTLRHPHPTPSLSPIYKPPLHTLPHRQPRPFTLSLSLSGWRTPSWTVVTAAWAGARLPDGSANKERHPGPVPGLRDN